MSVSGVSDCTCCGEQIMVANINIGEMCEDCEASECDPMAPCVIAKNP